MNTPTPIVAAHVARDFSRAAHRYDAHALLQQQIMETAFAKAEIYFPAQCTVLDIGCGTGNFAKKAQAHQRDWKLHGLDIAAGMLEVAGPLYSLITQSNMEALPLADNSVGAVFSSLALQWAAHPQQALTESFRVLESGGYAIYSCFLKQTMRELNMVSEMLGVTSPVLAMHDMLSYQGWMRQAGFQIASVKRIEEVHRMPSVIALFKHLRAIGATNKHASRPRHFTPRSELQRLMNSYTEHFHDERGIPVTWESGIFVLKKP